MCMCYCPRLLMRAYMQPLSVCFHTRLCVCMHAVQYVLTDISVCVCRCVYARTVATSITQSRELQSVKSTLTFMVLTSQGHPKAEHLEWSVTFQTENNSRLFPALWRRLFILSLTLIHFDLARGNNGLNTRVFLLLYRSRRLFAPLSLFCMLSSSHCVTALPKKSLHVTTMTRS